MVQHLGDSLGAPLLADLQLQSTDAGRCDLDCLQTLIVDVDRRDLTRITRGA